jgi:hypothetical protein
MTKSLKDTTEIIVMNSAAIGFSITECNEILTLVSLILAITVSLYKLYTWIQK